jgi:hypothetical protein
MLSSRRIMPHWRHGEKRLPTWTLPAVACIVLVLCRSWFFLAWEESYFDSDQALIGLMAKHLVEGRALPLFFYGQEYLLAIEAWLAAPLMMVFGSSVLVLRATVVLLNMVGAVLLVALLVKDGGLPRWTALLAASPFVMAGFVTGANLVETTGSNVEPFLWVLLAWMLRDRPLALGVCLGTAFLNREFCLYAAPALAFVQIVSARAVTREFVQRWVLTAVAFLLVYQVVLLAKPWADMLGPGTAGAPLPMANINPISNLLNRVQLTGLDTGSRLAEFASNDVPLLLGLQRFAPNLINIQTDVRVGEPMLTPMVLVLAATTSLLLGYGVARREGSPCWQFPTYLLLIGLMAALFYPIARRPSLFTFRYGLLALYVPIGLGALALHPARLRLTRWSAGLALGLMVIVSVRDHVAVLVRAMSLPPPASLRELSTAIEARGAQHAYADYWRAYSVSFISGERVKVASTDVERIREYRVLADRARDQNPPSVVTLQREPCGSTPVAGWYLCQVR